MFFWAFVVLVVLLKISVHCPIFELVPKLGTPPQIGGLRLQKRKFVNLAETTKTGPVETELADERIKKYSKMIEDMQAAHEKSCKPCSEATFMKMDAIIDMVERLIPLPEDADQVATALYRSRLDQIANEVITTHAAAMLLEGQTLGRLLRCPEDMSRTSNSEMSEEETGLGLASLKPRWVWVWCF